MHGVEVTARIADASIPSRSLSILQFVQAAVNTDEEYVAASENTDQAAHPPLSLDDILDNKVISGHRIGDEGSFEAIEEGFPRLAPIKFAASKPVHREDAGISKMIDRNMPEGSFDPSLNGARYGRLAAARRSVQQYDPASRWRCPV
jgi:hypothetical protein